MSRVSVREFSYNPSAFFARAEGGETIEITRHHKVIAVLVPGGEEAGEYVALAASGRVHFRPRKPQSAHPRYDIGTPDVEPLDALLAMREADDR